MAVGVFGSLFLQPARVLCGPAGIHVRPSLNNRRDSMKRHSPAASLALAALVVLGLAGPADAGEQVPFKGRLEGVVTVTPLPPFPPTFVSLLRQAPSNATDLGLLRLDMPRLVALPTRAGVGSYVFTAANGDMVFADFTGQATPTEIPGVLSIVEIANITGGTGRF